MRIQQNGINLDPKSDEYQGGGQTYSPEIEDFRVKDIGVVAAAATHQNKAQCDTGETDGHKEVILLLKDKPRFRFFIVCDVFILGHTANLVKKLVLNGCIAYFNLNQMNSVSV